MKRIVAIFGLMVMAALALPASANIIRTDNGSCDSTINGFGGPNCWNIQQLSYVGQDVSLTADNANAANAAFAAHFAALSSITIDLNGNVVLNSSSATPLTFQAIDINKAMTGLGFAVLAGTSRITIDFGLHDSGNHGFLDPADSTKLDPADDQLMRITWNFDVGAFTPAAGGLFNYFNTSVQVILGGYEDENLFDHAAFIQLNGLNGTLEGYNGPTYSSDALWVSLNNATPANGRATSDCFTFDAQGKPLCSSVVTDPGDPQNPPSNSVPEPSGLALLGTGLLALLYARRSVKFPLQTFAA